MRHASLAKQRELRAAYLNRQQALLAGLASTQTQRVKDVVGIMRVAVQQLEQKLVLGMQSGAGSLNSMQRMTAMRDFLRGRIAELSDDLAASLKAASDEILDRTLRLSMEPMQVFVESAPPGTRTAIQNMTGVADDFLFAATRVDAGLVSLTQGGLTARMQGQLNQLLTEGMLALNEEGIGPIISRVSKLLGLETGFTPRAESIVRTELGRVTNMAQQAQRTRLTKTVPGFSRLKKAWVWSGLSRMNHKRLSIQTGTKPIPHDEPFVIPPDLPPGNGPGGTGMFPHDPQLPAAESVNCACVTQDVADKEVLADIYGA